MAAESPLIELRVAGGPAEQHRVSLTDLTTIASGVQNAVRNVGAVLAGQATGRGGRKLGWIEQATELVLTASPAEGSVVFPLELADNAPTLDVDERELGPAAVDAFVTGLEVLSSDEPLPAGFDPGVLKALATLSPIFRKGYTSVELGVDRGGRMKRTAVTSERLATVRRLTQQPLSAPSTIEGVLIAVDLAGEPLTCRIDRPFLPSVTCLIPRAMREIVKGLIEHEVRAEGIGEFAPGAEEPRKLVVAALHALTPAIDRNAWRQHRPWQELALEAGTAPFDAADAPNLFDDDADLERFLAAAHGQRT